MVCSARRRRPRGPKFRRAAGNLKRAEPESEELQLLLRALQDVNLPKFLAQDLPLFEGIISDLFPGIARPDLDYGALMQTLQYCTEQKGLQGVEFFLRKNIQLFETICVRHGLMVVGPTGGGKTKTLEVLSNALTLLRENDVTSNPMFQKVHHFELNPKAITMNQLYGSSARRNACWCRRSPPSSLKLSFFS